MPDGAGECGDVDSAGVQSAGGDARTLVIRGKPRLNGSRYP